MLRKLLYFPNSSPDSRELNRLISAAVVNRRFCDLLLDDPATALRVGYNGSGPFHLTPEERELILSIRATSLADFAARLTETGPSQASRRSETGAQDPAIET